MHNLDLLAAAIIDRAAHDYTNACKTLRKKPDDHHARITLEDVESFFRSDWFTALSDADGESIINELKGE